ncbi:agmatinase [Faecalimonas umbilicata]|uniref:agmatinase n=1 Tax=Faecalimonas umbilicata TaxID=1912855 RepID=UPI002A841E12|nr:agmatinase [Faecalimonas umbilicata]MDY4596310.1 agmatinase [Faecalimonas umbilicata]
MLNKNVEVFMACEKEAHEADIVLFGAPFDSTTSYRPGTRFGSSAIRRESYGIECYSPYQDKDLEDTKVMDCGDLELCFGNTKKALAQIEEQAKEILDNSAIPFMLGGEHLVTLGAFRAVLEKYPDIHIIHFDAHADLREEYLGEQLSHASVIRRCWDLVGDGRIYQFGIRSGDREEFYWAKEHVTMRKFDFEGLEEVLEKLEGTPIYFTLDLDVLDPSVFPGTGTPEPGGVTFDALRKAAEKVCSRANVVACDVNELSPHYDPSGISTAVACKIVREMLLALSK